MVSGAGGSGSADTFLNCSADTTQTFYFSATGFGNCSPTVLAATATDLCTCKVNGCMNPSAENYNASATFDDGSCVTCASTGQCVLGDTDEGANCNGLSGSCCDEYCLTAFDCHPSFGSSYTSPNGVYYPSCYG